MTVYVDDFRAQYRSMIMCHMMADTTEELLEMADKIGVQRKWIQRAGTLYEHFDISLGKRKLAVQYGAREVSAKYLVQIKVMNKRPKRSDE